MTVTAGAKNPFVPGDMVTADCTNLTGSAWPLFDRSGEVVHRPWVAAGGPPAGDDDGDGTEVSGYISYTDVALVVAVLAEEKKRTIGGRVRADTYVLTCGGSMGWADSRRLRPWEE